MRILCEVLLRPCGFVESVTPWGCGSENVLGALWEEGQGCGRGRPGRMLRFTLVSVCHHPPLLLLWILTFQAQDIPAARVSQKVGEGITTPIYEFCLETASTEGL